MFLIGSLTGWSLARSGRSDVNRAFGSNFGVGAGNSVPLKNASRLAALNWKKQQQQTFKIQLKMNSISITEIGFEI